MHFIVILQLIFVQYNSIIMNKDYKSSPERLAGYFEGSRDKWRARSAKYQNEIRKLQIKTRDLSRSKEKWKSKYKELLEQHEEYKKKLQKIEEIKKILIEQ